MGALELRGVTKSFGRTEVIKGIDLKVATELRNSENAHRDRVQRANKRESVLRDEIGTIGSGEACLAVYDC